jgi:hypothetical protein
VEALSDALSAWGGSKGAIVVVSHDRNFCDKITFTHVATVKDGTFSLEERPVRESDWYVQGMEAAKPLSIPEGKATNDIKPSTTGASKATTLDPKLRKAAFNAPKRIQKIEGMIAESEKKLLELDDVMSQNGKDIAMLMEINNKKLALQESIDSYMKEWNELEDLLAQVAELTAA